MIRRSLLTAALILVGSVAIGESASANGPSIDVNFAGTVPGICNFGAVTNGTLGTDGMGGTMGVYKLSSTIPGGSPGSVTVTCNQSANLQVSAPIQTAGPTGNRVGAKVSGYSTMGFSGDVLTGDPVDVLGYYGGYPSSSIYLNYGSTLLNVNLGVEPFPNPNTPYLKPGNYAYKVTLTVTPQ